MDVLEARLGTQLLSSKMITITEVMLGVAAPVGNVNAHLLKGQLGSLSIEVDRDDLLGANRQRSC